MSSQLRLFDPQIKEKPDQESFIEPSWLVRLRHVDGQIKVQNVLSNGKFSLQRINVKPVLSYFTHIDNYKNFMFVCDDLVKYNTCILQHNNSNQVGLTYFSALRLSTDYLKG